MFSVVSVLILRADLVAIGDYLLFLFVARIKHHMALARRGFQEKIGGFECLWSPLAALNYAEGSCGRAVMIMQM